MRREMLWSAPTGTTRSCRSCLRLPRAAWAALRLHLMMVPTVAEEEEGGGEADPLAGAAAEAEVELPTLTRMAVHLRRHPSRTPSTLKVPWRRSLPEILTSATTTSSK